MICQSCRCENLDDAEFCSTCGVKLDAPARNEGWLAGMVAGVDDTAPPVAPPSAASVEEQPPTAPLDATTPMPEPVAPPAPGAPAPIPPPAPAAPPAPPQGHTAEPLVVRPTRRSSMVPIIVLCAVIAVAVIVAALALRPSDESTEPETTPTAPIETSAASVTVTEQPDPAGSIPTTDPVVETTTTATPDTTTTTLPETSTTATTTPTPDDPAAVPPVPDEPGPVDAPGSPQVLANVLPSGLSYAEVAPSFLLAQEFGDALALEDWDTARELAPGAADSSDAQFVDGYGATNRISLMLVDATVIPGGHRLMAVSVAVENNGSQTSLYCLTWDANTDDRTVEQIGGRRIARFAMNVQPEAIRNDAGTMATVNTCTGP